MKNEATIILGALKHLLNDHAEKTAGRDPVSADKSREYVKQLDQIEASVNETAALKSDPPATPQSQQVTGDPAPTPPADQVTEDHPAAA